MTVTSDNEALFLMDGLALSGDGFEKTLNLSPAPNQFGVAEITISAFDGA